MVEGMERGVFGRNSVWGMDRYSYGRYWKGTREMIEFIQNNTGWFSILAIIITIVMGLIGFSANVSEAIRKAQEK